jgi:hypothetical protein
MVKEKRTRGIPYLDSIDLEILEFLDKPNYKLNNPGWGILDLVEGLNIKHISLKPHIDKLIRLNLIQLIELNYGGGKKKIGLVTIRASNDFQSGVGWGYFSDEAIERMKEENKRFENILNCLKKVRSMLYDVEKNKLLEIDLRKIETQDKFKKVVNIKKDNFKKDTSKK